MVFVMFFCFVLFCLNDVFPFFPTLTLALLFLLQIFGKPIDEDTEMCFIDIAYDEIPERYYKESEVREKQGKERHQY